MSKIRWIDTPKGRAWKRQYERDRKASSSYRRWKKRYDRAYYKRNKKKLLAQAKTYVSNNRDAVRRRQRDWTLRTRYGITLAQYETCVRRQKGLCAICRRKPRGSFHVDHCHRRNRFRGLLCFSCNVTLGHLRDDRRVLRRAIRYLEGAL